MWAKIRHIFNKNKKTVYIVATGLLLIILIIVFTVNRAPVSNKKDTINNFDASSEQASTSYLNEQNKKAINANDYGNDLAAKYADFFSLAGSYYREAKYQESVDLLNKAIAQTPQETNYMTYELLAMSYKHLSNNDLANKNFDKALELINSSKDLPDREQIIATINQERL